MLFCYVDESGDAGTFNANDPLLNPLFAIVGLIVDQKEVMSITTDFIAIKRRFFPNRFHQIKFSLDAITVEIKGHKIRANLRENKKTLIKQCVGYLDACISLLRCHDVKLLGRILVKEPGTPNDDAVFMGAACSTCASIFTTSAMYARPLG